MTSDIVSGGYVFGPESIAEPDELELELAPELLEPASTCVPLPEPPLLPLDPLPPPLLLPELPLLEPPMGPPPLELPLLDPLVLPLLDPLDGDPLDPLDPLEGTAPLLDPLSKPVSDGG